MLTPRLLATESADTVNQLEQQQIINPPTESGEKAQLISAQALGRTFENVLASNQNNAQLMGRAFENTAAYGQAYAVAEQTQQAVDRSGIRNILASLAQLGDDYLKVQAERDKAAKKAAKEAAWIEANKKAEALISGSEEILRGQGGFTQYNDVYKQLLSEFIPQLDGDQVVELIRRIQDPVQRVSQAQASERREYLNKERNAIEEAEVQKGLFSLATISTFIKKARTPEELKQSTERYFNKMNEILPTLEPMARYKFVENAYKEMGGLVDFSQGQYIDLVNNLNNYSEYTKEAGLEYEKLKRQGPTYLPQYEATIEYLKQRHQIKGLTFADDPYKPERVIEEMRDREKKVRDAVDKGNMDAIEATNVTYDEIVSLAYNFWSNPSQVEAFGKYMKNPKIKSAAVLAEQIKQYDDKLYDINQKKLRINSELKSLDASDLNQWLEWVKSDQGQDLLEATGVRGKLNNRLIDILKGNVRTNDGNFSSVSKIITGKDPTELNLQNLPLISPKDVDEKLSAAVPPEEIQRVRSQIQAVKQGMRKDLLDQAALLDRDPDLLRLSNVLSAYRIRDPIQRQAQSKVATDRVQKVLERIEALQQGNAQRVAVPQMTKGGEQLEPPFKLPQLKEIEYRGNKLILPFSPNADVSITDVLGSGRPGGRLHAGVDIGASPGTSIVFYDYGKVIKVGKDFPVGYGNYIDIETRDGRVHRFAHTQGFFVVKGQEVRPGQPIGRTGDSGSPGSFHLHWEIRPKGAPEYGYSDALEDPLKYSTKLRQGWGRHSRNGDSQPRKVPPNSTRLSGGSYIQDGRVYNLDGSSFPVNYTPANPIRNRYASVNSKDYRPTSKTANYGYKFLKDNPSFATELNRTAAHIGVPGQWLADMIAAESGFQTQSVNLYSNGVQGASGVIQFTPDTAQWLGTSIEAVRKMDYKQQFALTRKYFDKMGFSKRIKNPYALLTAIWAGEIDRANRFDMSVYNLSDGDINFEGYEERLGKAAGRRYVPYRKRGKPIHTSYKSGCAICQSLARSNSGLVPHESA